MLQRFGVCTNPGAEMRRLRARSLNRQMRRLFADGARAARVNAAPAYPAMNVWANEDSALVTAELPGVNADDLEIALVDDTLTVSGQRQTEALEDGERLYRRERGYGEFSRTFQLPFTVEADRVEAAFEKGVLNIVLPRAEADKPKKIAVQAA